MKKMALFIALIIPMNPLLSYAKGDLKDDLLDILEAKEERVVVKKVHPLTDSLRRSVGPVTPEINIFLSFLDQNKWDKALYQWYSAFTDTSFEDSSTGRALFAYLLIKNNLLVNGVEHLFFAPQPRAIDKELTKQIRSLLPVDSSVWSQAHIRWQTAWTDLFGTDIEIKVLSYQIYDPGNQELIFRLLKKTKSNTRARAWIEWQMAVSLALNGDVAKSAKVLAHLLRDEQGVVSKDLLTLTAARLLFEQGYLDASIKYYDKIPKNSEYWFVAQEEKAWTYIRKGEPQNTMAISKTLMLPEFAPQVGPEVVFLKSLAELKVCDYPQVVKSIREYKDRFKLRSQNLLEIEEKGLTPATRFLISNLKEGKVKLLKLGGHASKLPRYVSRDEVLLSLVQRQKALAKEAKIAGEIYARSLPGGTAQVGFQAGLEEFKISTEKRSEMALNASISLIKKRAKEELQEIEKILRKMHIVEAELIQQVSIADRVVSATNKSAREEDIKNGTIKVAGRYDLKFPFVGETWFDELSNYNVDIKKGCQARKAN